MWRGPTAVRTDWVPTIGRSGDSPVSDGASSGFAVKSERTWSGWLVIVTASSVAPCMLKTSPSRRRARKTNSIWRWLKRSDWTMRGSGIAGAVARSLSAAGSIGPAAEGGACPSSLSAGRASGSVVAVTPTRLPSPG